MNSSDREAIVRQLTAQGVRVLEPDESTPENILGIIRENRRRHAHAKHRQAMDTVSARLAGELARDTGLASRDISRLLLSLSSKLGVLTVGHGVTGPMLCQLLSFAADDLDQQAKASGETGDDG